MNPGGSPSIWQIIGFSSGDSCSPALLAEMYWKKVPTDEKEDKNIGDTGKIQQKEDLKPREKQFITTCLGTRAQVCLGRCQLPCLPSGVFSTVSKVVFLKYLTMSSPSGIQGKKESFSCMDSIMNNCLTASRKFLGSVRALLIDQLGGSLRQHL